MTPTVGHIVQYVLDEHDASKINAWRSNFRAFNSGFAGHKHPHKPGTAGATGHIAHTGVDAAEGDELAAVVVAIHAPPGVNLKVLLDGNDDYWATGVPEGEGPGTWHWPERVS